MKPSELKHRFAARKNEVLLFQDVIDNMEAGLVASSLLPELRWLQRDHLAFLRASQFIHIYNLIESTINACLDVAEFAPKRLKKTRFDNLTERLRMEIIVQEVSQLRSDQKIADQVNNLVSRVLAKEPARNFDLRIRREAGNWRQKSIQKVCERREIYPRFPSHIAQGLRVGTPIDNITDIRNDLAHGDRSFFDVGSRITSSDLANLVQFACDYLESIIDSYVDYWDRQGYLKTA